MVIARGSTLLEIHGIGPSGAARTLADVGDITRFADRNRFASWTGTAPLDASSGEQIRHRLSRAGNRRMNHVLHIAAIVQLGVLQSRTVLVAASSAPPSERAPHHCRHPLMAAECGSKMRWCPQVRGGVERGV